MITRSQSRAERRSESLDTLSLSSYYGTSGNMASDSSDDSIIQGQRSPLRLSPHRNDGERIDVLETGMRNIVEKLDEVLGKRKSHWRSTPRPRSQDRSRGPPPSLTPRSPPSGRDRRRRRSPSPRRRDVRNFIEQHLEDEAYRVPRSEGKAHFLSDIHVKELIPKPYMYVDRFNGQTLKKKLESRDSVTALEYINAFISLLRDKRLPESSDHRFMFAHLHDVSRDAVRRPWQDIRQWSQRVFDGIERGEFYWDDSQRIQNERFSLALGAGIPQQGQPGNAEIRVRVQEVICPDYNSDRGCTASVVGVKDRVHHVEGNIKHAHICMYCMAASPTR